MFSHPGVRHLSFESTVPPFHLQYIHHRNNGEVDFNRSWAEYRRGFGTPNTEFWIGNFNLYLLVHQKSELYINITTENGYISALYQPFVIAKEELNYRVGTGTLQEGTLGK